MRVLSFLFLCAVSGVSGVMNPSTVAGDIPAFQDDYLWLVVLSFIGAFLMAYGIGANDVANSFATSVGAKSISLRQAIAIAAVCEFGGSVLMGAQVTDTVRKKIINTDVFASNPEMLMVAMFSALVGASLWLLICSYYGLPVSTTHSIIGALLGVGMAISPDAVAWKTVGLVVLSWVTSPLLSAVLAAITFVLVRKFALRLGDVAHERVMKFYPVLLFVSFWTVSFFLVFKTSQVDIKDLRKDHVGIAILVALGAGFALGLLVLLATWKRIHKHVLEDVPSDSADLTPPPSSKTAVGDNSASVAPTAPAKKGFLQRDIHASGLASDSQARDTHAEAEQFPPRAEKAFCFLQVVSAAFTSFAHGANDGANAAGPIAAIWAVYDIADIPSSKASVPVWILAFAGAGIVIGLATYGYNVMETIGVRLTKITPSRGFCIEISGAWVIIVGSNLGIPLSTTHCQVGATVGVGVCEAHRRNISKGVNWILFVRIIAAWVFTLVFAAITAAAMFSFISAAYAPRLGGEPCGQVSSLVLPNVENVHPGYFVNNAQPIMDMFDTINTDGDDYLSADELKAVGMDKTSDGFKVVKEFADDDDDGLTREEWGRYRCVPSALEYGTLLTVGMTRECEPLCSPGFTLPSSVTCELLAPNADFDDKPHQQFASYTRVPSCTAL